VRFQRCHKLECYIQLMKDYKLCLLFIFLPFVSICQSRPFEIFGTITGQYHSKIYLFFEGNYRQKDSISSEIKDGKFYFKGVTSMPMQVRLHMDQTSFIRDIYIDNAKTFVKCSTKMKISNNGQDTMNMLSVISVKGSATDKLKSDFENWLEILKNSKLSDEEKRNSYYEKLSVFMEKHPKSKVSPYLLGKASTLFYSQVNGLSRLIDTSLSKSFEAKSINNLLNHLDKSKNSAIGVAFQDFVLNDSNGHEVDTKDFRGKYTLVVCWASWCKPCREEHPELNLLYKTYKDKGFEMVGVSFDKNKENWTQAIVKDHLNWTQVIAPNAFDGEMAKYYGIEAIPVNFLLDKEGKIIGAGLTPKEIETTIGKVL
jgi:thiol-disulfide isomerase/thioredoxin